MSEYRNPFIRLIVTYCRQHAVYFATAVLSMLSARLLWFFPPVVVGVVFDAILIGDTDYSLPFVPESAIPAGDTDQFLFSVGLVTAAYILGVIVYIVGSWARAVAAYRVQHHLRIDVYDHVQGLDYEELENQKKGNLISIINNDVNQIESYLNGTLQLAGNVVFILLVVAAYMLILNWQLALLAFLVPAIIAVFNYGYSRYVEPKYQSLRNNVGDISSRVENNISGIAVIKTYTQEELERTRVRDLSKEYMDVSWKVSRARIALGQITGQLSNLGYVLVLFVGGLWVLQGPPLVLTGDLAAGTLLTFLIYNDRFAWPLSQTTTIVDRYQGAKASSRRVFNLLDIQLERDHTKEDVDISINTARFEAENLTFRYKDASQDALSDVSFSTSVSDTVGIVGPTGAGKSTLLKLLLRFYEPTEGDIRLNGTSVGQFSQQSYREAIGYVSQDPYLISGSVKDNILYGSTSATEDQVVEAARRAKAHDFIQEMTDGYDTEVGEGGNRLSGGQRQRIAIARAIVSDPEILILDEATSAVDNETELLIQQSLRSISENRTTFIVAHNLSTVRQADSILVLDDGKLVQSGAHDELVARDGLYADLWRLQTGEFDKLSERGQAALLTED